MEKITLFSSWRSGRDDFSCEAAARNAEEALAIYIETLTAKGDPIPESKQRSSSISLGVMLGADIEDEFRDLL